MKTACSFVRPQARRKMKRQALHDIFCKFSVVEKIADSYQQR